MQQVISSSPQHSPSPIWSTDYNPLQKKIEQAQTQQEAGKEIPKLELLSGTVYAIWGATVHLIVGITKIPLCAIGFVACIVDKATHTTFRKKFPTVQTITTHIVLFFKMGTSIFICAGSPLHIKGSLKFLAELHLVKKVNTTPPLSPPLQTLTPIPPPNNLPQTPITLASSSPLPNPQTKKEPQTIPLTPKNDKPSNASSTSSSQPDSSSSSGPQSGTPLESNTNTSSTSSAQPNSSSTTIPDLPLEPNSNTSSSTTQNTPPSSTDTFKKVIEVYNKLDSAEKAKGSEDEQSNYLLYLLSFAFLSLNQPPKALIEFLESGLDSCKSKKEIIEILIEVLDDPETFKAENINSDEIKRKCEEITAWFVNEWKCVTQDEKRIMLCNFYAITITFLSCKEHPIHSFIEKLKNTIEKEREQIDAISFQEICNPNFWNPEPSDKMAARCYENTITLTSSLLGDYDLIKTLSSSSYLKNAPKAEVIKTSEELTALKESRIQQLDSADEKNFKRVFEELPPFVPKEMLSEMGDEDVSTSMWSLMQEGIQISPIKPILPDPFQEQWKALFTRLEQQRIEFFQNNSDKKLQLEHTSNALDEMLIFLLGQALYYTSPGLQAEIAWVEEKGSLVASKIAQLPETSSQPQSKSAVIDNSDELSLLNPSSSWGPEEPTEPKSPEELFQLKEKALQALNLDENDLVSGQILFALVPKFPKESSEIMKMGLISLIRKAPLPEISHDFTQEKWKELTHHSELEAIKYFASTQDKKSRLEYTKAALLKIQLFLQEQVIFDPSYSMFKNLADVKVQQFELGARIVVESRILEEASLAVH